MFQIPSPFKKRQREEESSVNATENVKKRRSASDKNSKTSSFFKDQDFNKSPNDPREEKLKEIASKTREKLQSFSATDSETESSHNVADFNFGILQRAKASTLPDINTHESETVTECVVLDSEDRDGEEAGGTEAENMATSSTENVLSAFKNKRSSSVLKTNQKGNFSFSGQLKISYINWYMYIKLIFVIISRSSGLSV